MILNETRLDYIDFCKGIGIILMILGHIPVSEIPLKIIYGFHMPLFFFISGWLFLPKEISISSNFRRKVRSLLVPYFVFSFIGYILWLVEIKPENISDMLVPIKAVFWVNTENMPISGALWFLTAMLWCNVLCFSICKLAEKYLLLFSVGITLLGFSIVHLEIRLPWAIGASLIGVPFFTLGYLLRKREAVLLRLPIVGGVIIGFIDIFLILSNGRVSMRTSTYGNEVLFLLNASLLSLILVILSYKITLKFRTKYEFKFVKMIGYNSIVYLCANEIVINLVKSVFYKIGIERGFLWRILVILFSVLILILIEKVITNTKLKALIGK